MNTSVSPKVVAVTGASGGIGQALVKTLLTKKCTVALLDQDTTGLQHLEKKLTTYQIPFKIYHVDITNESEVSQTMQKITHDFGRFDALINNAGVLSDGLLIKHKENTTEKLALSNWQKVLDVNLTGTFLCGREAAEQMIQCGHGGTIINMSSLARHGNFGQSSYAASKAGVAALTVCWAQELARYNIRSVAIAPGIIETPMTAAMKPEALDFICKKIPVGRVGQPQEIGQLVYFILENHYINGRIIEIDGGLRF